MPLLLVGVVLAGLILSAPAGYGQNANDVDDMDITAAIESDLWIDDAVNANNIDVNTIGGVVTLTGSTDNLLAKERATTIASAVVGVRSVVNRIEVEPSLTISDSELANNVKDALLTDPATDSYEVMASVQNGIVTLTGSVNSWQEKQLCVTVAKGVEGVQGVKNNITIDFNRDRPDIEIKPEIKQRLANDVRVDDAQIEVEVNNGEVELSGTVGSLTEKNRAVSDALVGGVISVNADDLEIRWWARDEMRRKSTYVTRSDEEIKQAVEDAFLYDLRVFSFNPQVMVDDGSVTLMGTVDNLMAKEAAEQDARNTVGVRRVKNLLKVRPETIPSEEQLEKRVGAALTDNPYVSRYDVVVDAHPGVITLIGTVNNSFEKSVAASVASGVKGVTGVVNNLDYEYVWNWKPDWEIKEDVNDELFWSPFVNEDDVNVTVDRGIVTLDGNVETWSERINAEKSAWEGGAKDVRNDLTVSHRYYGPYPPLWPYLSPDNTAVDYHAWAWPPGK